MRDYRAMPYPVPAEAEAAMKREGAVERFMARARSMRYSAEVAHAALAGAHGATAKTLAEEGLTPEHRAHVLALYRWGESTTAGLKPERDEIRAVKAALDAWNFEHTLRTVVVEIRREIAARGARR